MMTDLTLPTGETVRFVFLRKWPKLGEMIYLQSIRSGRIEDGSLTAQAYRAMAPTFARQLAAEVHNGTQFDAVVSPRSSRADAVVYRETILRDSNVPDVTGRFSRKNKVNAATASSLDEVIDEFVYVPNGIEAGIKSLLIVDDSVASGNTIAAVLHHLREAGLPNDCAITVAAPAWLKGS